MPPARWRVQASRISLKTATAARGPPRLDQTCRRERSASIELGRSVARDLEPDFLLRHFRLVPFQLHGCPPDIQTLMRDCLRNAKFTVHVPNSVCSAAASASIT